MSTAVSSANGVFEEYAGFYDLIYSEKRYEEEAAYIIKLLNKNGVSRGSTILELGTGTGRHAEILARESFYVTGIERSQEMIEKCSTSEHFSVVEGDILHTRVGSDFDAALALFHVMSYLTTNDEIFQVLTNVKSQLKVGGIFLFDAWYTPAVLTQQPELRVKRFESEDISLLRIAEPTVDFSANLVSIDYSFFGRNKRLGKTFEFSEQHLMRHFSSPEVDLMARASGFELILAEEFLTSNPPGQQSWGTLFGLRSI